ncbi:hypothetical protein [Amycolatopsis pigmentata]|uniref:Uncharacterized protein n=1 Tax=Amycolatopsis pigmentata TaxID=450801 RepID=A0ABW5FYP9_9PSEU
MELDVYVHGEIDTMDASRVLAGLHHLVDLVKALGGGPVQFTHLREGSVDTGLRPLRSSDDTDAAFRRVLTGLREAERVPSVPNGWGDSAVQDGRGVSDNLGTFTDAGVELILRDGALVVDRVRVTNAARDHLKQATESRRIAIGSVIGRLDSLSLHDRREARLWPDGGGSSVTIRFSQAQVDEVRQEVGRRVEARGKLVRDYRGRPVSVELRVLTRLKTRDESPRLGTGAGVAPDALASTVKAYLGDVRGTA